MKKRLIILLLSIIFIQACSQKDETGLTDTHSNKRLRDAVVGYMSEPMFRNKDFVQQVTGTEADLKLYDLDEHMLYFAINKNDYDSNATLNKLTINKNSAEFGFENNGDVFLGAYTLKGTDRFLFRIPKNDFKPDSNNTIEVKLPGGIVYIQSLNELADFADNISVYGGRNDPEVKKNKYMADHGAFVSVKNEPSLKRLCSKIIQDKIPDEEAAQKLLDFVTSNISFSEKEAYGGYEVMKRPNEVLMTGAADCSGLTILFASLLEQHEIDYILVYFNNHIAAAVSGKFSDLNGLSVLYNNKKYYVAESTVKGFSIGNTLLLKKDIGDEILMIQKPGRDSKIINFKTGEVLN